IDRVRDLLRDEGIKLDESVDLGFEGIDGAELDAGLASGATSDVILAHVLDDDLDETVNETIAEGFEPDIDPTAVDFDAELAAFESDPPTGETTVVVLGPEFDSDDLDEDEGAPRKRVRQSGPKDALRFGNSQG